jgi:hypothetical protein
MRSREIVEITRGSLRRCTRSSSWLGRKLGIQPRSPLIDSHLDPGDRRPRWGIARRKGLLQRLVDIIGAIRRVIVTGTVWSVVGRGDRRILEVLLRHTPAKVWLQVLDHVHSSSPGSAIFARSTQGRSLFLRGPSLRAGRVEVQRITLNRQAWPSRFMSSSGARSNVSQSSSFAAATCLI